VDAADQALDRRLDPAAARPLAVAFSGGGDSLATLLAAKTWGDRVGRDVFALTVDHGLNPRSAQWTAEAGRTARRLGAGWVGLTWTGTKPTTGLPAAARQARHRLLAQAARDTGARVMLFGHTADDRAESELIRQATPGLGYLREWSPSPVWPEGRDLFVLRPLLQARRADLRAGLGGMGLSWLDDPANADLRYARSRARAALAETSHEGGAEAGDGVQGRERDDADLAALLAQTSVTSDGRVILSRADLRAAPAQPVRRLVGFALLCAAGSSMPPRGAALERLLGGLLGAGDLAATLCGARVIADQATIVFAREPGEGRRGGAAVPPLALKLDEPVVFDGRFELVAEARDLCVAPLSGKLAQLQTLDRQAVSCLPAYARGALPALVDAQGGVGLPTPFGRGPARARSLVGRRLAQACGAVRFEAEIEGAAPPVAPDDSPPYVGWNCF
jgi:tRNA(Ile)-lysidine synthase